MEKAENRENKNYGSVPFLPDGVEKIQKKQQKISKNRKIPLLLHFKPEQVGKGREREKIKIIVPFCSVPTRRVIKNSKKIAKTFKKLKKTIMVSFQAKIS